MKVFAVLILALVVAQQSYASSSEENSNYRNTARRTWPNFPLAGSFSQEDSRESQWSPKSQFQSRGSLLPLVHSLQSKIEQRLAGSAVFSNNQQYKQRLIKVAAEKLENCKKPNGLELDRQCVDRATGQVMQMIATLENVKNRRQSGAQTMPLFDY